MGRNSVFADRGSETIELYPTVLVTDRRGNVSPVPSQAPIVRKCSVSLERSQIAETTGNVVTKLVRITVRSLPDDITSWSRVRFRDADWDMHEPPAETGFSPLTKHWELTLRSRNMVSNSE